MPDDAPDLTPTPAELQLLKILWTEAPRSVREIHDALDGEVGYTTVLKQLQVMHSKGLVERERVGPSTRAHAYSPLVGEPEVQKHYLDDLKERLFSGSAAKLVARALDPDSTSAESIRELRAILDRLEEGT